MTNKEPGYVYILTYPSFREDWVKIGKSIEIPLLLIKVPSISHIPHFVTSHDFRGDALRLENCTSLMQNCILSRIRTP